MKTLSLFVALATPLCAQSTISSSYQYSWAANIGWTTWRPSVADGVVVGEYVLSGWIWAANVGWIHLGDGSPDNGIRYSNSTATDYGVNLLAGGILRGFAWSPNVGWVNFEATGNPRFTYNARDSYGYAWSANCGWINLDSAFSYIVTDLFAPGKDADGDGITDAWELEHTFNLSLLGSGDADGDGESDIAEYFADSDPLNSNVRLRITDYEPNPSTGFVKLTWTSSPRRRYTVEETAALGGAWVGVTTFSGMPGSTSYSYTTAVATQRFHRVRAQRP